MSGFAVADFAYGLIVVVFAAGQLLTSAETIFSRRDFAPTGLLPWRITQFRMAHRLRRGRLGGLLRPAFGPQGVSLLAAMRIGCAVGMVLAPLRSPVFTVCATLLLVNLLLSGYVQLFGGEGADQMSVILAVVVVVGGSYGSSPLLATVGLLFLAAQACLAYSASGVAKVVSPVWRSGRAVCRVLETNAYGVPSLAALLGRTRILPLLVTWVLLCFEVLFPTVLLLPMWGAVAVLLFGACFHVTNAVLMGLNSFVPAFVATYPAVLYVWFLLR